MSQNIGNQKTKHTSGVSKAVIAAIAGTSLLVLIATVAIGNGVMSSGSPGKVTPDNGGAGGTSSPTIKGLRAMDNEHCVNKLGGPAVC